MNNRIEFPQGYVKDSEKDYVLDEVTPKDIIPSTADLITPDTHLARHHDQQVNETIYRGVGASITSAMTTDQVLAHCGLDWEVAKRPVQFQDDNGSVHVHEKCYVISRTDTNQVLSGSNLASENWKIYQNREVVENFRDFCDQADLEIERLGSLKQGELVFAVAKTNQSFQLAGNDLVTGKLILVNSHRPGKGVSIQLMALRKVCTNALVMPVRTNGVTIRHDRNLHAVVPQVLQSAQNSFAKHKAESQALAQTPLTKEEALAILIETFGNPQLLLEGQPRVVKHCIAMFEQKTNAGAELLSAYNTCYGMLNCVTQYYNHDSTASVGSTQLNSLWLGTKAQHQQRIYSNLVSVAQQQRGISRGNLGISVAQRAGF